MKFKTKIYLAVAVAATVALAALSYGVSFVDDPTIRMALAFVVGGVIGTASANVAFNLPRTMHRPHAWGPSPRFTYIEECSECGAWR